MRLPWRQWRPNLIGYDALTSFGSPSYYAFEMFSQHHGDAILKATLTGMPEAKVPPLDYSVTKDTVKGVIYVKLVNVTAASQRVTLNLKGVASVARKATVMTLAGDPEETNSINDPRHLVPVTTRISGVKPVFDYTFAPHSLTVMELRAR